MLKEIILATNNPGKLKEFKAFFQGLNIELVSQGDFSVPEIEEKGLTFIENALIKARHSATMTGLPTLADDSGLVVPYLKGEPGIYSARYAGLKKNDEQNIHKLLLAMENVPDKHRIAFFYCALVFLTHSNDPTPIISEGKWWGKIALSPTGKEGFGYDPVFYLSEYNKTVAEIPIDLKNKISHRGIAIQSLIKQLREAQ